MKKLERLLWIAIGLMLFVWVVLWWIIVLPLKSDENGGQGAIISEIETIKEGKGRKKKSDGTPNLNNWGLLDIIREGESKEKKYFPSQTRIAILEEHKEYLEEQYAECLKFFMKLDLPLEIWFGGGSRPDDSRFHALFETEMGRLEQSLTDENIIIASDQGIRGRARLLGLDRAARIDTSVMQKNFWIQSALVDAMVLPADKTAGGTPKPRIWRLNYIKCGQWGAGAQNVVQPVQKDINRYFDLIKVSFEVEMIAADVPLLLRRIMAGRIHFHPHKFMVRKREIIDDKKRLVIPDKFGIVRQGKQIVESLGSAQDVAALSVRNALILPALLPLGIHDVIDFGQKQLGNTTNIPTQDEILRGIFSETICAGQPYPFTEPPVVLEVFMHVRDYDMARVTKMLKEEEEAAQAKLKRRPVKEKAPKKGTSRKKASSRKDSKPKKTNEKGG
ncbi:MAG: hypothetical protein ACYS8W_11930 [Planctomycetota bacterium]|jgi:hypothetical protein